MSAVDVVWQAGRIWIGGPIRLLTRARFYGVERIPREGGIVIAANHFSWVDPPLIGAACPRRIQFVAKIEAHRVPGLGQLIRAFGTIAVRRGESDRDAVRRMRDEARAGHVIGLFVEGTRQRSGRPGAAQPGAAMVALQENVPVVPVAIYGTQFWRIGNFRRCSIAFGEPLLFDGVPRNGRGYKEATATIERRIHELFAWLEQQDR